MKVDMPEPDAYRLKSDGYPTPVVVDHFKCTKCHRVGFWMSDMKYCPYCGNKIKHYEAINSYGHRTTGGQG